jgi:hypothetical protein
MNPIETVFSSGSNLYAVIHHADGRIWKEIAQEWQDYNDANWLSYGVALTEQGASGYYRSNFPAGAVGDFLTTEVVYNQAGVYPALGDAPATGIGQSQGVDVAAIAKSCLAAQRLALSLGGMVVGAVTSAISPTALSFSTDLPSIKNNTYQGRLILWATGALKDEVGNISASAAANGKVVVNGPFTEAPGVADAFIIV